MKSKIHFVASLIFLIPAIIQGDFLLLAAVMFAGWLIDADHEIDCFALTGKFVYNPLKIGSILGGHLYSDNANRMMVPLHAWEWLIPMILLRVNMMIIISFFAHLLLDVLGNSVYPQAMSILWRLKNKWKVKRRKRMFGLC